MVCSEAKEEQAEICFIAHHEWVWCKLDSQLHDNAFVKNNSLNTL